MPADPVTRVVLALERDAKTDPPTDSYARMTDVGVAYYARDHRGAAWFYIEDEYATVPCDPQPLVWYDPRPSESEPLTVKNLNALCDYVANPNTPVPWAHIKRAAARLRAALDALTE